MVKHIRVWLRAMAAVLALFAAGASAADIRVRVDRDPVPINESFQIIFEADGGVDDDPDFSPLKKDFQILSTSQSSNISIINGRTTRSKSWTLTVLARRTGALDIPTVRFGSDRSPADRVTVTGAGTAPQAARDSGEAFIEVEAKPLDPYVQSQILYTVRLYLGVSPANASLSEPQVEGAKAIIERLGEDKSYDTRVMAQRFEVIERRYAIYPQASGALTILPLRFQGQIGRSAFSILDPFGPQPRTIVRQSAPVTLNVKPIPDAYAGSHWLPAGHVSLREEWSADPPVFRAGEPITRTLTLVAEAQTASQLPEVSGNLPADFKAYPDQPLLSDSKTDSGVIGSRQEKTALIPSRPGDYLLPAVAVTWWNTATGAMEVARLRERWVTVLPAATAESRNILEQSPQASAPRPEGPDTSAGKTETAGDGDTGAARDNGNLAWQVLSLVLALGWLSTLFLRRHAQRRAGQSADQRRAARRAELLRRIRRACTGNDAAASRQALLAWAEAAWPEQPPRSLGAIASRCKPELAQELENLNAALYGRGAQEWRGKALWQIFERQHASSPEKKASVGDQLEPLFRL